MYVADDIDDDIRQRLGWVEATFRAEVPRTLVGHALDASELHLPRYCSPVLVYVDDVGEVEVLDAEILSDGNCKLIVSNELAIEVDTNDEDRGEYGTHVACSFEMVVNLEERRLVHCTLTEACEPDVID